MSSRHPRLASADLSPGRTFMDERPAVPLLLCDAMLVRLARSLRMAGYDTALAAPAEPDAALVARGREEARCLLSRDRALVAWASRLGPALLVPTSDSDAQAAFLAQTLGVDWQHAPFTRCLVDNAPLAASSSAQQRTLPEAARAGSGPFLTCPACGRLFWPGSHVRRMAERLARWRRVFPPASPGP